MFLLGACFAGAESGPTVIRLGYFPNITHAQALYARATGAFERPGKIRIDWVAFNSGPAAIESLFGHALDAAFIGPGPTINAYLKSRGEVFTVVSGSAGGGAGLVVRADSGIQTEADFGGKTIATPQLGNTQDVAARAWLAEHGYRLTERGGNVSLVPLSNPDQLTMFQKRQIDGAWTVEPWLSRLEIEAGGRLFLDEKSLWPDGRYVTTHLIVRRSFLADHEDSVRELIAGLVDVTREVNSNRTAAATVLNLELKKETRQALKDEVIQRAMERVVLSWDPICASLKRSAEAAHQIGFLRKEPDLRGLYSLNVLNDVLRERSLEPVEAPPF